MLLGLVLRSPEAPRFLTRLRSLDLTSKPPVLARTPAPDLQASHGTVVALLGKPVRTEMLLAAVDPYREPPDRSRRGHM